MSSDTRARVQQFDVKPARLPHHAQTRIWFWNSAGAQTFVCPAHEARAHYKRLTAEGAVVWHTDVYHY
jgi:hypothetical protein